MLRHIAVGLFAGAVMSAIAPASAQTPAERGGYLVNTLMTCNNCHTPMGPQGPDFSKALSGGLSWDEPPFKVTAPNISPDPDTGIGKWTDAQIKTALRKGKRPDGSNLAPIMPTGFYELLTDKDVDAIVAYLRTVKSVKNQTPAPVYKMAFQRDIPPNAEKPMAEADLSNPVKKGFYLVTAAHCMECHTPMDKGRHDFKRLGAGGTEFPGPWGKSVSRNITSHKEKGLGAWTDDEIKRAITQGIHKDGTKLKPPMGYPYYARMTPDDLNAVVAYLRTVPAAE
jgi:mono/diheme cytochrome c family protein